MISFSVGFLSLSSFGVFAFCRSSVRAPGIFLFPLSAAAARTGICLARSALCSSVYKVWQAPVLFPSSSAGFSHSSKGGAKGVCFRFSVLKI
jgi:hypothetical protein